MFIFAGFISFLLYYIYDLNMVFFRLKAGSLCFMLGTVLLSISSIGIIGSSIVRTDLLAIQLPFVLLAVFFLVLLIYTLFFALPAKETYMDPLQTAAPKVCNTGMYALCRHPGVLWLSLFYLCVYFALRTDLTLLAWILFSVLDLLYILLQDIVIFPRQFNDYADYKRQTPFLIPTISSIRSALRSMRKDH